MSLKLNKINDAIIQEDILYQQDWVKKFLSADPASPMRSDPVRYSRRLAFTSLTLGLDLYQQERNPAKIRESLALAAKSLLALLALPEDRAVLPPLDFEEALALAVCFCPPAAYQNIDQSPLKKFFVDPADEFCAILGRYLDVLRKFLPSRKLDQAEWKRAEAQCLRNNASRYDAEVNLAKLRALKGVAEGDSAQLNQGITTLVEDYENEVKHGENQRSSRAFICLPALMFARLGADRKLECTIRSPYLPLYLLTNQ